MQCKCRSLSEANMKLLSSPKYLGSQLPDDSEKKAAVYGLPLYLTLLNKISGLLKAVGYRSPKALFWSLTAVSATAQHQLPAPATLRRVLRLQDKAEYYHRKPTLSSARGRGEELKA